MMDSIAGGMYGAISILGRHGRRARARVRRRSSSPRRLRDDQRPRVRRQHAGAATRASATRVQWDVLALGDEHHTFHVHGHRWRDADGIRDRHADRRPGRVLPLPLEEDAARDVALPLPRRAAHDARHDRHLPGEEVRRALPLAALALAVAAAARRPPSAWSTCPAKYFVPPSITDARGRHRHVDQQRHRRPRRRRRSAARFDSGLIGPGGALLAHVQPARATTPTAARSTPSWPARSTSTVPAARPRPPDLDRPPGDAARHRAGRHGRGADRVAPRPTARWAPVDRRRPGARRLVPRQRRAGRADRLPRGRRRRPEPAAAAEGRGPARTTVKRLKGGRYAIRATARPAQPGALAALQLYSRERFRWRQVAHARVGARLARRLRRSPPGRYAARVVILRGKGGYGASVGPTRHVGGHAKQHRAAPCRRTCTT